MTRQARAEEIEFLRWRYRVATREKKRLTAQIIASRLQDLVLRQIRSELTAERRSVA